MPEYILEPTRNKCVAEFDTWSNSANETVITVRYYRWAEIIITRTDKPIITVDDIEDNGVNILEYFKEEYSNGALEYNLNDCYRSEIFEYPSNIRRKRKERIDDLWDEESDLSEDGWDITDTELMIFSEINVNEQVNEV